MLTTDTTAIVSAVADEILAGDRLTIPEAAALTGAAEGTIWSWLTRGVAGPDGRRVRLEGARCGVLWRTSRAALKRFMTARTALAAAAADGLNA